MSRTIQKIPFSPAEAGQTEHQCLGRSLKSLSPAEAGQTEPQSLGRSSKVPSLSRLESLVVEPTPKSLPTASHISFGVGPSSLSLSPLARFTMSSTTSLALQLVPLSLEARLRRRWRSCLLPCLAPQLDVPTLRPTSSSSLVSAPIPRCTCRPVKGALQQYSHHRRRTPHHPTGTLTATVILQLTLCDFRWP